MNLRSYLYVSAAKADHLAKAPSRGADALIVDIEDGVGESQKEFARENLRNWLSNQDEETNIYVRVNSDAIENDIAIAVHPRVKGIVLPKSSRVEDIELAERLLNKYEHALGNLHLEVIALIESAEGVLNAFSIAQHERVCRIILGEIDLRSDLSLDSKSGDETIHFARNTLLFASAAAKIDPPVASVSTNFKDLVAYKSSTIEYAQWGYFGRTCIHPAQIPIVNEVFSSSHEELEWARDILARLDHADEGATVDTRGEMIDEAVAKIARKIMNLN